MLVFTRKTQFSFLTIQSGQSKIPVSSLRSHIVSEYSGIFVLIVGNQDNS